MSKSKYQDMRILVVDDEPMMSDSLRQHLVEEGYAVDTAASGAEAIDLFDGGAHHLVICDLQLPDMDGLTLLRHMKDAKPATEVIVVTGYGSVQAAVEATKAGAFYFVEKPFDFEELSPLVEKALERRALVAETESMRRQLSTRSEYFNIIGSSKQMQTIYETIESVAKSDANVLIVGESGTGKELIANAIHYNSLRAKKPFRKKLSGRFSSHHFNQSHARRRHSRWPLARRSFLSNLDNYNSCTSSARAHGRHSVTHRLFPETLRGKIPATDCRRLTVGIS